MNLENLELHDPWLLLVALPGLLAVWWAHRRRRPMPAIVFPSVARFRGMRPTLRQRLRKLPMLLQALAVVGLAAALARPRQGDVRTQLRSEGIAIQLVLDRSSSMEEKMPFDGREATRFEIVKRVFRDFVSGNEKRGLGGRKGDLIGLTTFARFTEESCPLVADHQPIITAVNGLETVPPAVDRYGQQLRREDVPGGRFNQAEHADNPLNATAIGDGIQRAVLSLVAADEDLAQGDEDGKYEIRSKVIILLTDGKDTASEFDPVAAGKLAEENDIRLYFVLLSDGKDVREDWLGRKIVVGVIPREELLRTPREVAGSPDRAFLATDGDALEEIYREIDALEKSEVGRLEYRSYDERFLWFLVPSIGLIALAYLLQETWLRRVP